MNREFMRLFKRLTSQCDRNAVHLCLFLPSIQISKINFSPVIDEFVLSFLQFEYWNQHFHDKHIFTVIGSQMC